MVPGSSKEGLRLYLCPPRPSRSPPRGVWWSLSPPGKGSDCTLVLQGTPRVLQGGVRLSPRPPTSSFLSPQGPRQSHLLVLPILKAIGAPQVWGREGTGRRGGGEGAGPPPDPAPLPLRPRPLPRESPLSFRWRSRSQWDDAVGGRGAGPSNDGGRGQKIGGVACWEGAGLPVRGCGHRRRRKRRRRRGRGNKGPRGEPEVSCDPFVWGGTHKWGGGPSVGPLSVGGDP